MKIAAFIFSVSLLSNLSFASRTFDSFTTSSHCLEHLDTAVRHCLVGEWTNVGTNGGFSSLSFHCDGKFAAVTTDGQRICGSWELDSDGSFLLLRKACEKTGNSLGTLLLKLEMLDSHMLQIESPAEGLSQTFVQ